MTVLYLHPYIWKELRLLYRRRKAMEKSAINMCLKKWINRSLDVGIWLVLWCIPQPSTPCVFINISTNPDRSLKFYDRLFLYPGLWIRLTSHYHSAERHESVLLFPRDGLHQEAALVRNKVVKMKRSQRYEYLLIRVCTNKFYKIFVVDLYKIIAFFIFLINFNLTLCHVYLCHIDLPPPMLRVKILWV